MDMSLALISFQSNELIGFTRGVVTTSRVYALNCRARLILQFVARRRFDPEGGAASFMSPKISKSVVR